MVYRYSSRDIGKDRVAVFVNGEEEIASRRKADSRYVFAMGEWERIGFVSTKITPVRSLKWVKNPTAQVQKLTLPD